MSQQNKLSAENEPAANRSYLSRAKSWFEFQQDQGRSLGGIVGTGILRIAKSGVQPNLVDTQAANDGVHKKLKKKGKTEQPALDTQIQQQCYEKWIEQTESLHKLMALPSSGPLISIIVPVYNTPMNYLVECIESVQGQSYEDWQLILIDDKSSNAGVTHAIRHYSDLDDRIVGIYLEENGHISKASQAGLDAAEGQFVALLDHDDVLAERALARIAFEIIRNPDTQFFYSDEDKIDGSGQRYQPHFKSDWNPQLLMAQNYICHLSVINRELALQSGGFRTGYEGSQDHDLFLRCTAKLSSQNIQHIPEILYHWRATEGSTALDDQAKDYSNAAGLAAVQDFLNTQIPGATVEAAAVPHAYKVNFPIPEQQPKVCLIIPTRNHMRLTKQAIDSIFSKTDYENYEILLVDNGSTEVDALEYFSELKEHDKVRVLSYDKPFNYSAINNFAVANTDAEVIGLINNDVEVINRAWLTEMVSIALQPSSGCVGAKLYYGEDNIQHAGVILGIGGVAGHSHKYFPGNDHGYFSRLRLTQNLSAVTAACLIVRKEVFDQVNGLEEEALTVAFNDVDFCMRVGVAGYQNVWTPHAELYHHESISRGEEDSPEKAARFNREADWMREQWGPSLSNDPYYSPNLSLTHEDFSIRLND